MAVMPNTPDTALLDKLFADMRTLFERARAEAIPGIEMKSFPWACPMITNWRRGTAQRWYASAVR